jgi:hypothetical protein
MAPHEFVEWPTRAMEEACLARSRALADFFLELGAATGEGPRSAKPKAM